MALLLVSVVSPLVPRWRRATWVAQWRADLWHFAQWLDSHGEGSTGRRAVTLLSRTAGSLTHALTLRIDEWSPRMLTHDVKFAWRSLVRRPGFSVVAVLILGLGIGANATIFSWVEAILLQPVPGVDASRLVALHGTTTTREDLSFSYPNFLDLRAARPEGIDDLIAFRGVAMNLTYGDEPRRVWGQMVTPNFLEMLRVRPLAGRGFDERDGSVKGREPVAILAYDAWQRIFGGDPEVIGRSITLNARPFTIIGITPREFRGTMIGFSVDLFVPITLQPAFMSADRLDQRGGGFLQVYGRLADGATSPQAQASLAVAAARLERDHPVNDGRGIVIEPVWLDGAAGILLPVLATLMAVVGVVLLIACANLAGLMLARASARQLLIESALLAVGGGVAGVLLASWTSGLLMALVPPTPFPVAFDSGLSVRVLAYSTLVTVAAAFAFGLLPALRTSRPDVGSALKDTATAVGGGVRRTRMRNGLVVAQVALSLLLLVCAALFLRGLTHAQAVDRGFAIREGLIAAVDLLPNGYDQPRGSAFHRLLLERVAGIPGVESATVAASMPLDIGGGSQLAFAIPGYTPREGEEIEASYNLVGDRYFATMGIPILTGRALDGRDVDGRQVSIVINETMARRFWDGDDPVGRTVTIGSEQAVIVGIAKDGKYQQLNEPPQNFMYMSIAQFFRHDALLIVRTTDDPATVIPSLQAAVTRLDPNLPLFDIRTVAEQMKMSVFIPRMASVILVVFGALSLLLASVGLYSVVALSVAQRTREIGVRVALGATRGSVMILVLRQGLTVTAIGLAIGGLLAVAAAQALRSQLMGVAPTDVPSFAWTTVLLLLVALLACVIPARRAARLDPVRALRID